jgi:hypothetical protein
MHRTATMCRVLGVSPGGYYARLVNAGLILTHLARGLAEVKLTRGR